MCHTVFHGVQIGPIETWCCELPLLIRGAEVVNDVVSSCWRRTIKIRPFFIRVKETTKSSLDYEFIPLVYTNLIWANFKDAL